MLSESRYNIDTLCRDGADTPIGLTNETTQNTLEHWVYKSLFHGLVLDICTSSVCYTCCYSIWTVGVDVLVHSLRIRIIVLTLV